MGKGFACSKSEPTLYTRSQEQLGFMAVCVYVDDIIFIGNSAELLQKFKEEMMREFSMTDLGSMQYVLRMEVLQTSQGIFLSQEKYAKDLL